MFLCFFFKFSHRLFYNYATYNPNRGPQERCKSAIPLVNPLTGLRVQSC